MARPPTIAQSRAVAVKLAFVLAVCLAMGLGVLSARQRRLAAANELARLHDLIAERQRVVLTLRAEIMHRAALPRVRAAAARAGLTAPALAPNRVIGPAGPEFARLRDAAVPGMVVE
ncbi:MAG: hypothetical protein D6693_03140 [Planctomycetota bacterium]|nr:MAG: hypothetical protein D6693_03140 [Planctomycetota bacterium]